MARGGERGTRVMVLAVVAQVLVAGSALAARGITGSATALAIGALGAAAAGGDALMLRAARRARRDVEHPRPSGHARSRYFWPLVVAVVLALAAAGGAAAAAVRRIDEPRALVDPAWAYGILAGALVVTVGILRAVVVAADQVRRRAGWRRFLVTAPTPELPVLLVHASAGVVSLVAGLAAVGAAEAADPVWDGVGAATVAVVLATTAVILLAVARGVLVGEPASPRDVEAITAALEVDPAVRRLVSLRTQHQGPDELLVAARVELDHALTLPEVAEVLHRIERNVRRAVPTARATYLEPDVADEHRAAPAVEHHVPSPDIPPELRARLDAEARRGSLGEHIVVEDDLRM